MKPKTKTPMTIQEVARLGGSAGTDKQNAARAENGKKGGRPSDPIGTVKTRADGRDWKKTRYGWKPLPKPKLESVEA